MPHDSRFDSDFDSYASDRNATLRNIRQAIAYLKQLEQVVKAMPAANEDAGYLDLDNIEQLHGDTNELIAQFCTDNDWESLKEEFSRLGL
jgi:5-methylcytosine-specific restriction endonuclease McrBC regulatory subunit McrC